MHSPHSATLPASRGWAVLLAVYACKRLTNQSTNQPINLPTNQPPLVAPFPPQRHPRLPGDPGRAGARHLHRRWSRHCSRGAGSPHAVSGLPRHVCHALPPHLRWAGQAPLQPRVACCIRCCIGMHLTAYLSPSGLPCAVGVQTRTPTTHTSPSSTWRAPSLPPASRTGTRRWGLVLRLLCVCER